MLMPTPCTPIPCCAARAPAYAPSSPREGEPPCRYAPGPALLVKLLCCLTGIARIASWQAARMHPNASSDSQPLLPSHTPTVPERPKLDEVAAPSEDSLPVAGEPAAEPPSPTAETVEGVPAAEPPSPAAEAVEGVPAVQVRWWQCRCWLI